MMSFYSTKDHGLKASLKEAVLQGLAPDGGLFMPEHIPLMDPAFFQRIFSLTFPEIAWEVSKVLLQGEIPLGELHKIIDESMTFEVPLVKLSENIYTLELFHGPTLSFKDFGARFMARLMEYYNQGQRQHLNILAATSGDTGSAVGQGFLGVPGIRVWILYPKGQVSTIQEKQLATIGNNVTALEIDGTFDDCQSLVKRAFHDKDLCRTMRLTSANSINIARLIPQAFYYFYAFAQLKEQSRPIAISVPSGNFGNLTAGLIAKRMGLSIERFIAATNINDSVPKYLETGHFEPRPSKPTLSNAMDVGNPSNFARILDLYDGDLTRIRRDLFGISFSDEQTKGAIGELNRKYRYVADPHGAVAYLGLTDYLKRNADAIGVFLETAHPAKFLDVVEPIIERRIVVPGRLQEALDKPRKAVALPNDYGSLKGALA